MSNLITSIISWALLIGLCGGLVDTTIAMRKNAAQATRIGIVSLSELNRALTGTGHKPRSR